LIERIELIAAGGLVCGLWLKVWRAKYKKMESGRGIFRPPWGASMESFNVLPSFLDIGFNTCSQTNPNAVSQ
jgi:hypothetical protein